MKINNNIYLMAGLFGGLAMALVSVLQMQHRPLPEYAVARVNEQYITKAVYERALASVDADKRAALSAEDRKRVLDRLIDEELLIQYGVRQGLLRSDRQVKSTLVQSVIQAKSLEAEAREIPEEEIRAFFNDHQILFSRTERVRVGMIRVPVTDDRTEEQAYELAREARERLMAGEEFSLVALAYHEGGALNLPNVLLPPAKLVDYLGPTLASMSLQLDEGVTAEPVLIGMAWQLLHVYERTVAPVARLEEVREQVVAEMRRRAAEASLRLALDEMRKSESLQISREVQ